MKNASLAGLALETEREDTCPDTPAAEQPATHSTVDRFETWCWARARLCAEGILSLHDAVDVLQAGAERQGLVEVIGQDAVQEIIASQFEWWQRNA